MKGGRRDSRWGSVSAIEGCRNSDGEPLLDDGGEITGAGIGEATTDRDDGNTAGAAMGSSMLST